MTRVIPTSQTNPLQNPITAPSPETVSSSSSESCDQINLARDYRDYIYLGKLKEDVTWHFVFSTVVGLVQH